MRGKVGVVLGASGDWACLTAMELPLRPAERNPASPKGGAYTRNAQKSEFYLLFWRRGRRGGSRRLGRSGGSSGLGGRRRLRLAAVHGELLDLGARAHLVELGG